MLYSILLFIVLLYYVLNLKYNEYFTLPNSHNFYMKYRNYIDGNYKYPNMKHINTIGLSKISDTCFSDNYNKCIYSNNSKNMCQITSLVNCVGPSSISGKL